MIRDMLAAALSSLVPVDYSTATIVGDGNSLMYGQPVQSQSVTVQLAALLGLNPASIPNRGVGGQTTTQMIARTAAYVDNLVDHTPGAFNVVFAIECLNAIASEVKTVEQHCADIFAYYTGRVQAGFSRVGIMTMFATNTDLAFTPAGDTPEVYRDKLAAVNAYLISGVDIPLRDIIRLDLVPELQDEYDTVYFQTDRVHLTVTGYAKMTACIYDWLMSIRIKP